MENWNEVLQKFRDWSTSWDNYKGDSYPPKSIEGFIEDLDKFYTLERK